MNRGNRRIIVASIILTLPLAILLGSFSTGAPPYKAAHRTTPNATTAPQKSLKTTLAQTVSRVTGMQIPNNAKPVKTADRTPARPRTASNLSANTGGTLQGVRQVVGESDSGLTGGILHAFTSGKKNNTAAVATANRAGMQGTSAQGSSAVVPVAGVLDGLVDAIKSNNRRPAAVQQNSQPRQRAEPNWEGIPFHTPTRDTAALKRAPIRDPNAATASRVASRPAPMPRAQPIARAPSTTQAPAASRSMSDISIATRSKPKTSLRALPVSSRLSGSSTISKRRTSVEDINPLVKTDSSESALSTSSSSRRSGRRTLSALDPSEIAAASTSPNTINSSKQLADQLVPSAPRRFLIDSAQEKADAIKKKAAEATLAAKTAAAAKAIAAAKAAAAAEVAAGKQAAEELAAIKAKAAAKAVAKTVPSASIDMKPAPVPASSDTAIAGTTLNNAASSAVTNAPSMTAQSGPATLKKPEPMTLQVPSQNLATAPQPTQSLPTQMQPLQVQPTQTAPVEKQPASAASLSAPTMAAAPANVLSAPTIQMQTPSTVAAHRSGSELSGPPSSAFEPTGVNTNNASPAINQSTPRFTAIGSGVIDPSLATPATSQPTATPQHVAAPRIAQAPASTNQYDRNYNRDPYLSNQYQTSPNEARQFAADRYSGTQNIGNSYAPQGGPVTRPMRTQPAPATTQLESNFQARDSRNIPNEMRPAVKAPPVAAPAPATTARPIARPASQDSNNSVVASELPGIRVVTHGPKQIMIRQTHQFEIRVENRGSIDAQGVMVRAMIPDWAEVRGQNASRGGIAPEKSEGREKLVWTIDDLPAGSSEKMFVRLKAERSGTHGLDVDWTLMPQKSVTEVQVREPQLELTIEGPEEVVFGQSQTYRVRVLNPGDGVAPNVVFTLSPNSPTPQTQRIGDIPPGKEAQFEVELTAQDLGDLKIAGLASGDLELRAEASKTIRVSAARLAAMLTGPELKYQDTDATYNLEIQNKGVATSEKITATLRLPVGVKYIGGIESAVQRGSSLTWQVSSLPPSAVRNYQFMCKMSATGEQNFAFDCKGSAAGSTSVSLSTTVESIADLVMTISDPAAPAPVGTDVTYEITIRNRGSKAATDVRAIAQFSHGIEPRRVEGHSGELLTGQVLFDPIPTIRAGDEVRLKVVANAARPGHHRFRSEIRAGDTILVSEEATHYMNAKSDRVSRRSSETQIR